MMFHARLKLNATSPFFRGISGRPRATRGFDASGIVVRAINETDYRPIIPIRSE